MKSRRTGFADEIPAGGNRVLYGRNEKTSQWRQSRAYQEDFGGVKEVEGLTKRKSRRRKSRASLGDFGDKEEVAERNGSKTRRTKSQPLEGYLVDDEEERDERNERKSQRRKFRAHVSVAEGKRAATMSRLHKSSVVTKSPPSERTSAITTRSHRDEERQSEPCGVHKQGAPVLLNRIRRSPRRSRYRSEASPTIGVVRLDTATFARGEVSGDMPSTRRRKGRPKKNTEASNDAFTEVSGDWIRSREEGVRQDRKGNERTRKLHGIVVENRGNETQDLPASDGENVMMTEQNPSRTTNSPSQRKRRRVQRIVEEDSEVDAPLEKATVRRVDVRDSACTDANSESPMNTRKKQRTHIQSVPASGIEKGSAVKGDEVSPTDNPKQNTKKSKSRNDVTSPQLRTRSQGMLQGEPSRARLTISGNQRKLVGGSDDEDWEADTLSADEWDSIIHGWMLQGQVQSSGMNWVGLREMWDALCCPFGLGRNAAQIVPELAECRPAMSGKDSGTRETANKSGALDDEETVSEQVSDGEALEERKQAGCEVG
ncbi:unnamed protein product [Chondrus crispus]|uniref:Uncharacterized protein n=1 Tax=Chondrus crispus TaxID=2769 RepID=R7QBF4_CHOCR|nr:unnamed protein product [Chondrus crispus]CDF34751.1 unnamed protein product [Chondrus crispus]|eukprot:XP_005714570.1 unnamed protein product [Chondrus crispus]